MRLIRLTLSVHDLPKLDYTGWCDPYVEVSVDGENRHTTQVLKGTRDAIWNDFPLEDLNEDSLLEFKVHDHDRMDADDLIGTAEITAGDLVTEFLEGEEPDVTFKLEQGGTLTVQMAKINMNLQVIVTDLAEMDNPWFGGKTDAYFIATVNGETVHTSEVAADDENAMFHPFPVVCDDLEDELTLTLFDEDNGADDYIGVCTFSFEEILEYGRTKQAVKNGDGELMANVVVRAVEKLRKSGFEGDLAPICAERDQETFYELEARVQEGGFHGSIYILDRLGKPGRWLNNVLFAGKKEVKLFIAESCCYLTDLETDIIEWVMLFDNEFHVEQADENVFIHNLDRRMRVTCGADVDAETLVTELQNRIDTNEDMAELIGNEENPGRSFALPRPGTSARWFVQGRDYYWYLSEMLERAQKEIFITDWWFSPEIELRRPFEKYGEGFRLEEMLVRKAEEGVKIYIQLFSSLGEQQMLQLGAPRVVNQFNPFPNIQVITHGAGLAKAYLWSHHEKLCVVDQCVAFVGGIDLCANRYDDDRYLLLDTECENLCEMGGDPAGEEGTMIHEEEGKMFPGKDYLNSFIMPASNMDDFETDLLDRSTQHRMPWQDIASVVYGKAAYDVSRHFIQRWNFTKMQQQKSDDVDELEQIRYILPAPLSQIEDRLGEIDAFGVQPEEGHEFASEDMPSVTAQVLRSFGNWSGGVAKTETSIQRTYIDLIKNAEKFVYIENQFFVTTLRGNPAPQREVANRMGQAIVDRVIRAHEEGEDFKIYIIIPLMPEFNGDIFKAETEAETLKTIMHYQYAGINKDCPEEHGGEAGTTIFTKLESEGINPADYIHFGALRTWQRATTSKAVTELIYVHSKLLIVDDKHTVIGSANFNDRSQEGARDSEVCVYFKDDDDCEESASYARTLRLKLWNRFSGNDVSEYDPASTEFFDMWKDIAQGNSQKFEQVFRRAPNNSITNFAELGEYPDAETPLNEADDDGAEAAEVLDSIQGVLIDYPLQFLINEWYHPDTFEGLAKEKLVARMGTFT